jgi:hypothetical protein
MDGLSLEGNTKLPMTYREQGHEGTTSTALNFNVRTVSRRRRHTIVKAGPEGRSDAVWAFCSQYSLEIACRRISYE